MNLKLSFLRRPAALASLLLAMAAPATGYSAEQIAPVGTRVQPVGYNSCPNGDCYNGGGRSWGGGWRGNCNNGGCPTCNGGGLFGCGCHHGLAGGYAFVRPPATWPLARTSNMYNYYWNARLSAGQAGVAQPGLQYPMVYQPTDTTQMGFAYQAVPRWHYRPELLPAAPAPNWPMGMNGGYGGYGGTWGPGTTSDATTNNTTTPTPANTSPVTPAPVPPVAPPPPVEPQVNVPEPEATFFPNRIRRR